MKNYNYPKVNYRIKIIRNIFLLLITLVILSPVLWMILISLRPKLDIFEFSLRFTPTFEAYHDLLEGNFFKSFFNSLLVGIISTSFSMALGTPAAWVLSRWNFKYKKYLGLWILITRMAPPIAFTIPFFLAYRFLGLHDTIIGLSIIHISFNLALVIWLMQTFFSVIPVELEEAAWLDGCGLWKTFYKINLPLVKPGVAATAILCFIFSWNDFFYSLILTRTKAITAPVAIVNFLQYEGWEWSKIAASGALVMLPVILFTLLVRNYLIQGLTAGSLKD